MTVEPAQMTATEQLAEYVANLRYEDLPAHVIEMAKLSIRDIVSVALFASDLDWTMMAAAMAREAECAPVASVWGHGWKTSAPYAALVNGTAAHGIEMDDRSHNLEIHNGAATVSAAIAMAERCGRSGRDIILGVVCGYEVAFRVARATRGGIWPRFYSDGIRSFWGAAAAAGKLLELDKKGMVYTFGITGSMASGLMEDTLDPFGTMVKRLQGGGWQGYSGVTAALLAQQGLTAPRAMIDGEDGFCNSFCTVKEPDLELLTRDLGEDFEMLHWETKPYATRGAYHSAIDAVKELRAEHGVQAEQVERIVMGASSRIAGNSNVGKPDSVMAAQYNLPFVISAAFRHDLANPAIWNEQHSSGCPHLGHVESSVGGSRPGDRRDLQADWNQRGYPCDGSAHVRSDH